MSGIEGAAVGAAAGIGVAAYNALSGFSARHDHSHDTQAADTRRLIDDFNKLRRVGDMDDEDYALYMEKKDIALQSGKAYRDSISEFKSTTALNPVKKLKKRAHVRKSKRRVREANQSLQDLYYTSCSGSSDASSVAAESGSPPESQNIREWAETMTQTSSSRSATGSILSNRRSQHIKIEQYTLSFHNRLLIKDADVSLSYGCRYGLLGENGSGKSTFLQSLAERDIKISQPTDIHLVKEEAEPSALNAVDFIVESVDDFSFTIASMDLMDPKGRAKSILRGLGFSPAMMVKPTKDLCGGWCMRVALAQALFIEPHLLLLDEPTNHLDVGAIVWLEAYLSTYNGILVITSNSANFMDNVCTNIIDLTSKKLVYYDGNYSGYVETKQENEANRMEAYRKQQEEIVNIKECIATVGTNIDLIGQVRSKQKIIHKTEAAGLIAIAPVLKARNQLQFNFKDIQNLPLSIIDFDGVAFSYSGNKEDHLYRGLSFRIDVNSRVAILGAKGAGKSTLLDLMCGALQPNEGIISRRSSVKLAKYPQRSDEQLPLDEDPIDFLWSKFNEEILGTRMKVVNVQLNRFGVSQAYWTLPIKKLSGGLRNRLVLARLAMEQPHILLFDEPTNHLDMEAMGALTRAIKEFQGGVVIVSNNCSFINEVAKELWEVTNKGIRNLTKEGITIMGYKESLFNQTNNVVVKRIPKFKAKHAPDPDTRVQEVSSTGAGRGAEQAFISPEPPRRASVIKDPYSLHPYYVGPVHRHNP